MTTAGQQERYDELKTLIHTNPAWRACAQYFVDRTKNKDDAARKLFAHLQMVAGIGGSEGDRIARLKPTLEGTRYALRHIDRAKD